MRFRTRSRSSQKGAGKFEVPNWDHASQKKVRDALLVLGFDDHRTSSMPSAPRSKSIRSGI